MLVMNFELTQDMPRKHLFRTSEFPYHLTGRSNNRDWFAVPLETCWNIFATFIAKTEERYGFRTHAFVLMSNHYHWLVTTPEANLDEGMRYFMTETSRAIARAAGRINHVYGGRYKPTLIKDPYQYACCLRYILRNPLRAGICLRVEEYPWSSLNSPGVNNQRLEKFESLIPSREAGFYEWLNAPTPSEADELIQKALRRAEFRFPRTTSGRSVDATKPFWRMHIASTSFASEESPQWI